MFKDSRGQSTLTLAIYMAVLALLTMSLTPGVFADKGISDSNLKSQAVILDGALSLWLSHNSGVYPPNLTSLQGLQSYPANIDLTPFTYTVNGPKTLYRLTVTLKNGTVYVSPNSKM